MVSRREFVLGAGMTAGAWIATRAGLAQSAANPYTQPDPALLKQLEAAGASETIRTTKLRDTLFLLEGAGGNIVCLKGPDGKLLIDAQTAAGAPHLLDALGRLDARPPKLLVNTHWHPDHTDGNAAVHMAGALVIAHINTRVRLSSPQYMAVYDLHVPAAPDEGLPQQTFREAETLWVDNEQIRLKHVAHAHTDSDIFAHFQRGNVIHTGDLWFNGMYPLIDTSTGGAIGGMIRGVDECLALADDETKIVPGHGPLGNKAGLAAYRGMLATVSDRVKALKAKGDSLEQAVAAKPTADLDATWKKPGAIQPDTFVALVYTSL